MAGLVALGLDTMASAYVAVAGSLLVVAKKPQARAPIYLWLLANSRLRPSGWLLQNSPRHEVSRQARPSGSPPGTPVIRRLICDACLPADVRRMA